jgi:hypothetical protein
MYKTKSPISSFIQILLTLLELLDGRGDLGKALKDEFCKFLLQVHQEMPHILLLKSYVYSYVTKFVRG